MKQVSRIFWLLTFTWLLAACGGGGSLERTDGGTNTPTTPTTPPTTTSQVLAIELLGADGTVSNQVTEGGPLTVRATLTDSGGSPVVGEVVSFTLSTANLVVFSNDTGTALTDASGVAEIEMLVGELSGSGRVTASVVDGPVISAGFESSGASQQSPFSLELFASSIQLASSGSDEIELIAVVKSEQNILLADVPVTFSADQNASITVVNSVSGADGTSRALLTTQNNQENREIMITATSGQLSESITVRVVGTEVNINGASSVILNDSAPITFVLSDSDGQGIAGQALTLTTDIGTLDQSAPVTNANGQVTVNFTATQSGTATITASALNASASFSVNIQQDDFSFTNLPTEGLALNTNQTLTLRWFKNNQPFANGSVQVTTSRGTITAPGGGSVATTNAQGLATVVINSAFAGPASISAIGTDGSGNQVTARASLEFVASDVDSIFVDATPDLIGPEGQTATVTAVVRDAVGNLVKGKTVNFRLFADSTGGSISPNTATTDSNGIASTVYSSNAVSSEDGVTIEAESDGVTAIPSLTVGDRAFDISIGTGNEINVPDQASYRKDFAIFVTDAAGRPIANAALTASSTPPLVDAYRKGFWQWDATARVYVAITTAVCQNEDTNGNGRLDAGEDTNGDGQLTPGNIATVNFSNNVARTDANGQATIELRYARQFGGWVQTVIGVFGQSSGTESSELQEYSLGVASDDLTQETSPPPSNPFGFSGNCANTL
jgi:hypothetical protein